ncbi:flagellar biosynthetic protein FliO [Caloranaerobacter ferrireducens]|uniref:flagellar biosynthetic protein FliO n=1 Tax=Caloranaerobacter ferrireducens TaxID=1323370 RepID=UPI00084D37A7|nr:flagellar biosynthetic protein FliO [Caloranaerobacter ferrireducens]
MKNAYLKSLYIFSFLFINEYAFGSSYIDNNKGYSFINLISFIFGFILVILAILFLSKILNFKLNVTGKKHRIRIIDILNISGIKILILEINGRRYILAYNNNSITLIDKLENIEPLESDSNITNKSSFDKHLEKFLMKINFRAKS